MGKLTCQRCGATAEGDSFDEADARIDHALGLSKGRPCSGKTSDLVWNTKNVEAEITSDVTSDDDSDSSKPKKQTKRR
ncbi:MAG TPA: hypothetical protein VJ044_17545 [Candidatus Hodarchaeales archaeon]|nr:hypothetical protein [Candidatus Hodarchaeales archaeon]